MKKKTVFALGLALILALSSVSALASSESSTKPESDDTVYKISIGTWDSEAIPSGQALVHAVDYINEKGGGRIEATPYFSETLLTAADALTGTAQGLCDIHYWQIDLVAGTTPVASMLTLPFTQAMPKSQGLTNAVRELILETGDNPFQAEMADMNLTWVTVKDPDGMSVHLVKDQPVYELKDLQGLKLEGVAEMNGYVALGGGTIVVMAPTDFYTSMEKGVVDGCLHHLALTDIFATNELTKSHTLYGVNSGIHCCTVGFVANLDFWNSLPEDIQQIVREGLQLSEDEMIAADNAIVDDLMTRLVDEGQMIYEVPEEEMTSWYEAGDKFVNEWLEERQKTSQYDLRMWYDKYMELATKHMDD